MSVLAIRIFRRDLRQTSWSRLQGMITSHSTSTQIGALVSIRDRNSRRRIRLSKLTLAFFLWVKSLVVALKGQTVALTQLTVGLKMRLPNSFSSKTLSNVSRERKQVSSHHMLLIKKSQRLEVWRTKNFKDTWPYSRQIIWLSVNWFTSRSK